ncbi:MAG: hypothetical protein B1H13_11830 [Desulfobacteraceae bacterium 4484_190.3]|nr:MAG: hypothetical protein B1H13_11830 [Desulfobacteraceae bacterium 4484_190.3]
MILDGAQALSAVRTVYSHTLTKKGKGSTASAPLHTVDGMPVCVIGPDRRSGKERRSGFDRRDFMIL